MKISTAIGNATHILDRPVIMAHDLGNRSSKLKVSGAAREQENFRNADSYGLLPEYRAPNALICVSKSILQWKHLFFIASAVIRNENLKLE